MNPDGRVMSFRFYGEGCALLPEGGAALLLTPGQGKTRFFQRMQRGRIARIKPSKMPGRIYDVIHAVCRVRTGYAPAGRA